MSRDLMSSLIMTVTVNIIMNSIIGSKTETFCNASRRGGLKHHMDNKKVVRIFYKITIYEVFLKYLSSKQ